MVIMFQSRDKFLTRVPHFKVQIIGIHVAVLAPWFRDYGVKTMFDMFG